MMSGSSFQFTPSVMIGRNQNCIGSNCMNLNSLGFTFPVFFVIGAQAPVDLSVIQLGSPGGAFLNGSLSTAIVLSGREIGRHFVPEPALAGLLTCGLALVLGASGASMGSRRGYMALLRFVTVLLSAALLACAVPVGTGLGGAVPAPLKLARAAWIASVEIEDPGVAEARELEGALGLSVKRYIEESRAFERVGLLPGEVGADDVVLRIKFRRYAQRRGPHPAYLPLAILTLTAYIWAGGPIYRDSSDLAARIEAQDREGRSLASVEKAVSSTHDISFLEPAYAFPSGLEARTTLMQALLDELVAQLQGERS